MGVITKIEGQKNKQRFNIFVDNAFFCGIFKETAILAGLKEGKEISEAELEKLVFDSEVKRAFEKAGNLLAIRQHSKKELFDKLLKKEFDKEVISAAILKLQEYRYIDDLSFAKTYATENKKYSKKMLENKLKEKGISKDILAEVFEDFDEQREEELCEKYAKKYISGKDMTKEGVKDKLTSSLLRKGFRFETIKKTLQKFSFDNDEWND